MTPTQQLSSNMRYSNQTVLVTGAAGALGRTLADRLAKEGATVVAGDIDVSELPEESEHVIPIELDVTSAESWAAAVQRCTKKSSTFTGLAHCAGILGPEASVLDLNEDAWTRVLSVNLTSSYLGLRAVLSPMLSASYGRIMLCASLAGKTGNAMQSAYSVSKAGVIALAKSAAKEVADRGVTINSIAPSITATGMGMGLSEDRLVELIKLAPMGRFGTADEFASVCAWALSEEASYTTGFCFDLSGGRAVS